MIELETAGLNRFALAVTPGVCVGPPDFQFLFGGAGLAAAVAALEAVTGRPTVWAAAQYLSYARPPSVLDLDVVVPVAGKHSSQARVTGHVEDTEILTVNAALGSRPQALVAGWAAMPAAPPPDECEELTQGWSRTDDDIRGRIDLRVASPRDPAPAGRSLLWARRLDGGAIDRVTLAVFADFLPSGISAALGRRAGGNSLDNTIRYVRVVPTEWVLLDTQIDAVADGFGHGRMYLFAQDGTLMASASQSLIVRLPES
ncbi:acyl-CoA thioesterase domain-containing protein [Glacieibacterium frigidum]|uniref:Acyl-CoA thioesterase n=1 Tax=Glacieibacterium frigidum TaxID=2593303 RepID=A0A552UF82_9SPHN|nr:acyl-CoA thioesterase domain-containing protein [Glacieibacterium frigidum]TRW16870.1 acyl-CoA thioesterase [Glacieibacterium frigidum]